MPCMVMPTVQHMDVPRLSKGHAADNLELLQWLYKFLRSKYWPSLEPGTDLTMDATGRKATHEL